MSGGEKQALAFASVYAMNPEVYVLDEPSANLDQEATLTLERELRHIKAQGKTIIIAEHRLYYRIDLIDRAVYIDRGKVVDIYSREEFLSFSDEQRCHMGLRSLCRKSPVHIITGTESNELTVRNLSYTNKKTTVFENISFSASSGEIIGILGKNGAGKTTLMRCLAGLLKQKAGSVTFNGQILSTKKRNEICCMIMQDVNHQLFGESGWNECLLSAGEAADEAAVSAVLADFELLEYRNKHPMALSGSQKQRLAIATGVLADKKILLLDEPRRLERFNLTLSGSCAILNINSVLEADLWRRF